jgi:hypothetical protein
MIQNLTVTATGFKNLAASYTYGFEDINVKSIYARPPTDTSHTATTVIIYAEHGSQSPTMYGVSQSIATIMAGFASGSQIEIDAIEAAVALAANGAYIAPTGSHLLDATTTEMVALLALDTKIGANLTPVARPTNHPTVAAETIEANLALLDAAIGIDTTSNHIIAAANSVTVNQSLIDAAVYALQTALAFNGTSASITALGANQGGAALLTAGIDVVSGANGALGVILPAVAVGTIIKIFNIVAANNLLVYPATGEYVNAVAQNGSLKFSHATLVSSVICTYASAGHWTVTAITGTIS